MCPFLPARGLPDRGLPDRLVYFWAALAALAFTAVTPPRARAAASSDQPNIIFIMADDLGYTDLACFGSKYYETPNIDRLAAQGMKLTNHHHHQNCAPTRAAIMTGQYSPRTGIYTVGNIHRFENSAKRPLRSVDNVSDLPLDRVTIAQTLKAAGYATGMFGKWHLGHDAPYHPGRRGFDEAIVSNGVHFDFPTTPKTEYPKGQYLADFLTDRAVDFIQRHKDERFFLYLPHFGVHSPLQAKPELIAKFKAKPGVGGHNNPTYAAMIASVDESVGRVMATLAALKLAENTVLMFASDNGGVGGLRREGIEGGNTTDNAPLRAGKGSLYEGGTRVPFIVRWPGKVKAGSACDVPSIHVDLYPTFTAIGGGRLPANQIIDGESLVPLWRNPQAKLAREAIYQHFPGYLGSGGDTFRTMPVSLIHAGDWKLMEFFEDGRIELYNLREDIGETRNLAASQPARAKELHAKLLAWRAALKAPLPTPNPNYGANAPGVDATETKKAKGTKKAQE